MWTTCESADLRFPWPSGRADMPKSGGNPVSSLLLHHGSILPPQELRDVVRAAPALPSRPRALPAGEWLGPGPRARGGPGTLVDVAHPRLDFVEEALHLLRLFREDARREPVFGLVGFRDRLLEPRDRKSVV